MRTFLLIALVSGGNVFANDADTKYRELVARDDALMERVAAQSSSVWEKAAVRAKLRRLEADYRSFIQQDPQYSPALVAFGGFLYDQGRVDEGLEFWQKAVAIDPHCAKAYNNLAAHYGHFGRAGDALRYHQKAFELDPSDPIYHFNWATTCILFRKDAREVYGWDNDEIFRRSLEEFRKARDLEPASKEFAWAYAESFYQVTKPDWPAALDAWRFCLDQASDELERERVYVHLARVCIHARRFDEARTWLAKINTDQVTPLRRLLERRLSAAINPGSSRPSDRQ